MLGVELRTESIASSWLIDVNPRTAIIAIAAAAPPRIPNFLLDEKLNAKLVFGSELSAVGLCCNLVLISGCFLCNGFSSG